MNEDNFEKKVERELQSMSSEQVVFFAWLCALRALPYIGAKGNFNCWKKKERQKHLYALFRDLDANCYYRAVYVTDIHAYGGAAAARAAARANIESVILSDIKSIQKGDTCFKSHLNLSGPVWQNFQQALKNEGCSYWGRLYQDIYEKSFELDDSDLKALKRRMSVPEEIQQQGAAAVAIYLEDMEKGATHLNEARIIILGEKGAGKTCLARRLIDPAAPMTTDKESTKGVVTTLWKLKEDDINARIWDFAGHTVTHAVHQFFLSERCMYILVYDGRTEGRNRIEYWLNQMKNYGGQSEVFILINERDQHPPQISITNLQEKYPAVVDCFPLSIEKDRDKLDDFRKIIAGYIKNNPSWSKLAFPLSYFHVKQELEELFTGNRKEEYINITKFNEIAQKYKIEKHDELLKNLHALGICLRYENMKDFDTLVLNPEWISHGIYKIINWVHGQKQYAICENDFLAVFEDETERYPADKHAFLFQLMKRYELAYETEQKKCLIIPHLLPEDRPKSLPDFPLGDSLMLRYQADLPLPPDTVSRFIVRHNEDIQKKGKESWVWRYGVVLEDGKGSTALVREWEEERRIEVSVKGKAKTEYLNRLRESLNNIFSSYKSEKPELQYRIIRFGEIPGENEKMNPLFLPDRQIYKHHINEQPYYDYDSEKFVPMNYTVQNYNITTESFIQGGKQFIDKSTTFNFHNCNINLQGSLNELASSMKRKGEDKEAKALEDVAGALKEAESCKRPDEVKRKGIDKILKRIMDALGDETSKLHKIVKGINNGIDIAQDIAEGYNDLAQWVGFPQVPKPFLNKKFNFRKIFKR